MSRLGGPAGSRGLGRRDASDGCRPARPAFPRGCVVRGTQVPEDGAEVSFEGAWLDDAEEVRAADAGLQEDESAASASPEGDALPLYSNFSDALESWQLLLLEEAYASTSQRRKISVSASVRPPRAGTETLARASRLTFATPLSLWRTRALAQITELSSECKLSRSQVLGWLKSRSKLSEDQAETIRAACLAAIEREEALEETYKKKEAKKAFADLSLGERRKARTKDAKISPLALKTLIKFWGRNRNPTWQNINDIARMTKLSPSIVRGWFKEREPQKQKSSAMRRRRRRIKI